MLIERGANVAELRTAEQSVAEAVCTRATRIIEFQFLYSTPGVPFDNATRDEFSTLWRIALLSRKFSVLTDQVEKELLLSLFSTFLISPVYALECDCPVASCQRVPIVSHLESCSIFNLAVFRLSSVQTDVGQRYVRAIGRVCRRHRQAVELAEPPRLCSRGAEVRASAPKNKRARFHKNRSSTRLSKPIT